MRDRLTLLSSSPGPLEGPTTVLVSPLPPTSTGSVGRPVVSTPAQHSIPAPSQTSPPATLGNYDSASSLPKPPTPSSGGNDSTDGLLWGIDCATNKLKATHENSGPPSQPFLDSAGKLHLTGDLASYNRDNPGNPGIAIVSCSSFLRLILRALAD